MSRILMRHSLWKSVENFSGSHCGMPAMGAKPPFLLFGRFATDVAAVFTPRVLHACSACAGDYEDPDRTAGGEDESGDDVDANSDEFPAEEAQPAGKEAMQCGGRNKRQQGQWFCESSEK